MNKPAFTTCLIGHWATVLVVWGVCVLCLLQWSQGLLSDVVPFLALLMMAATANARRQRVRYQRWKRAWDAMGGVAPRRWPWGTVLGTLAWMVTGLVVYSLDRSKPETTIAIIGFVAGSLLLMMVVAYLDHGRRGTGKARPRRALVVSICLPVPRRSPGRAQFYRDLPLLSGGARR